MLEPVERVTAPFATRQRDQLKPWVTRRELGRQLCVTGCKELDPLTLLREFTEE